MKIRVAIYGLFTSAGKCIYVGATRNAKSREMAHRNSKSFKTFKVFRRVKPRYAFKIEKETILKYRSLGQANLNRNPKPKRKGLKPYRDVAPISLDAELMDKLRTHCIGRGMITKRIVEISIEQWMNRQNR